MALLRSLLLKGAHSPRLRGYALRSPAVRRAVRRFMPGERLEDALAAARQLHARGLASLLTLLGEDVTTQAEADAAARNYLEVLDRVHQLGLDAHVSLKLTQLGLDVDPASCLAHVRTIAARAAALNSFVAIDMESTRHTDATLALYRRVRNGDSNVGICLQAYLRRTASDVAALLPLAPVIRLVKGAYREPPALAFSRLRDVDASYVALARQLLGAPARAAGARAVFGTHDPRLIATIASLAAAEGLARQQVEFQMLYGIRSREQLRLADDGFRVRTLISYGDAWFAWYIRRLAERPANLLFLLRSLAAR